MDIRSLACFVAVAEQLNFHRAAARLNITQPALSQRIRVLEQEVGTPLLYRDRRKVSLTPAGREFLDPARAAVASAGLATLQARRAASGELGHLRLGFTVIGFYSLLPSAVRLFRSRFQGVTVELTEMISPLLERALVEGALDMAVLHPPLETAGLALHPLPDQQLVLAMPASHPLSRRKAVRLAELRDEPFLMAPRPVGPRIHDRIIAYFQSAGFSPRVVQEVTPMTSLTGFVSAGEGLGFVTEGIAAVPRPAVVFRPVSPQPPSLPMALAWRQDGILPTGELFLKAVQDTLDKSAGADPRIRTP